MDKPLVKCPACDGDGRDPSPENAGYSPPGAGGAIDPGSYEPCPLCRGAGEIEPSVGGPLTLRVLCPDGNIAEELTSCHDDEDRLLRYARLAAANCDDVHDKCNDPASGPVGPHRIERATWTEVSRDEVDA